MSRFVKVASVDQIDSERGTLVECEGKKVALFSVADRYYAIEDTCTHRGGPLAEGDVEGHVVTCPWHGGQFDLRDGNLIAPPPPQPVRAFLVVIDGEDVALDLS